MAGEGEDGLGVVGTLGGGNVARDDLKIGEAYFDADGVAEVGLALQVVGDALAQCGENVREFGFVLLGVQIALKGAFAADRFGLGLRDDRPLVAAMRGVMQPDSGAFAKVPYEKIDRRLGEFADAVNFKLC